jgi:uncharacterized iron-regulated protein
MTRCAGVALAAFVAASGQAVAQDMPEAEILVLGEVHDNPAHHERQAEIVADRQPVAIVFEMLTPQQAAAGQEVSRGDAAALADALDWEGSGWPDFAMYFPIFAAAPAALIYGAALPRDDISRGRSEGAAAVFGKNAAMFGLGELDPEDQAAREAEQAVAHCDMLPPDLLPGMVEVQRLRDAHFARVAIEALDATGGPVAVITGNGHARTDIGIPSYIRAARPEVQVVALGQYEDTPEEDAPFDVVAVSPGPERDDPCDAFR